MLCEAEAAPEVASEASGSRCGLPTVALAVVGWAFAFLAVQSGEPLEHHVRDLAQAAGQPRPQFGDHPELGEMTGWLSLLFALGVAVFFSLQRWLPGRLERKPLAVGLYVVTCVIGFLALFWMLRAGHSGADLVWGD